MSKSQIKAAGYTEKDDCVMDDFEATCVATDSIRVDIYDDDIEGETRGRYTKIVSLRDAMSMVICLTQAINRAELIEATNGHKK